MVERGILVYTCAVVLLVHVYNPAATESHVLFSTEVYRLCLQIILFSFKSKNFIDFMLQNIFRPHVARDPSTRRIYVIVCPQE